MNIYDIGFQANQVQKAIDLLNKKISEKNKVVLAFTGNVISSGLRETIRDLVKYKKIDVLVTSGSGVEEDIIKTFGRYQMSDFNADSKSLRKESLYRIGNMTVHHDLYEDFDRFLHDNYKTAISHTTCDQTPGSIARKLAFIRRDEDSFLYWAERNNINVFCPTFHDGAFGDFFVEYRNTFPDYRIDFLYENVKLTKIINSYEACGILILGGGTSKHFALNNSILRGGYDWAIKISTAIPFDGSDSGGDFNEAVTWEKLKENAPNVHIYSDVTLVLPHIVKSTFFK